MNDQVLSNFATFLLNYCIFVGLLIVRRFNSYMFDMSLEYVEAFVKSKWTLCYFALMGTSKNLGFRKRRLEESKTYGCEMGKKVGFSRCTQDGETILLGGDDELSSTSAKSKTFLGSVRTVATAQIRSLWFY